MFYKEEPKEAILHYLQRLKDEGVDISEFRLSELPDTTPEFVRFKRGPSEKTLAEVLEVLIQRILLASLSSPSMSSQMDLFYAS